MSTRAPHRRLVRLLELQDLGSTQVEGALGFLHSNVLLPLHIHGGTTHLHGASACRSVCLQPSPACQPAPGPISPCQRW